MKYLLIISLSHTISLWLFMVISTGSATALRSEQYTPPVLDTAGRPLQSGVEYYVKPAITDSGGRFTIIDRNNSCKYYAGQESFSDPGFPVIFAPFAEGGDNLVRVSRDLKITFSVITICMTSTTWQLAERDPETQRRLIGTGNDGKASNYFRIVKETIEGSDIYTIQWCPYEFCPLCRFDCGTVGPLVEDGNRLLALDGSVLPVVFERA